MKKASSSTNIVDDLSSIFGGSFVFSIYFFYCSDLRVFFIAYLDLFLLSLLWFEAAPTSGEFQEVEGETEERRRARLERHQRTKERAVCIIALLYLSP